ncbi:DUF2510 domain-containing protein [Cellulomonas sp. Root137]|uniref:DUF2510 domain-containing protein n=1 Tax=Cellulomonas sp. Root137 TaxID=1736459 RepID=UPI0006F54660|nr:DUF2510 domain-containing protein [Cellulomonas sp. Root137]KQY46758.1 hypothetical protein ASD18_04920 [Cellulomonas sp. Root137]
MDAVAPSWYPDPQRDGYLRWWDGTRWTEHVQPGRAPGKPVLGQEVTDAFGPITFYGPSEPITHAFPPITDSRYAGSPLAEALADHVRAGRSGGDVQIRGDEQAAVEALYQLRSRGGVLGAAAGIGEQLLVETLVARPGPDASAPGWMEGPGVGSTAPGMQSAAGRAGYEVVGRTTRGVLTALAIGQLVLALVFCVVFVVGGVVLAVAVPSALPAALMLVAMGVLVVGLLVWTAVRRRSRGPW